MLPIPVVPGWASPLAHSPVDQQPRPPPPRGLQIARYRSRIRLASVRHGSVSTSVRSDRGRLGRSCVRSVISSSIRVAASRRAPRDARGPPPVGSPTGSPGFWQVPGEDRGSKGTDRRRREEFVRDPTSGASGQDTVVEHEQLGGQAVGVLRTGRPGEVS